MNKNKIYRFLCYLWIIVPILSLVRLSQPVLDICMDNGPSSTVCFAMPVKTYNGLQLLFHGNLVNDYNTIVIDIKNPGLLMLKIMIVLQLVCDVTIVCMCIREWKEKQSSKTLLRLRGILSIGYVLTAFAIYRLILICCDHLEKERYHSLAFLSYARYNQSELEVNILLSIGVFILFIVTWLFYRARTVYQFICYLWIFVPLLSFGILMQPVIAIEVDAIGKPITEVQYNGLQLLYGGDLVNEYKDLVIDGKNSGYVAMKMMIALQLVFDVILVFIPLWEWRKKRSPGIFLGIRGVFAMGYVLTAHIIHQFAEEWSERIEIKHDPSRFFSSRRSYISLYWGSELNVFLSIGVVIVFIVTLSIFFFQKKITCKMQK